MKTKFTAIFTAMTMLFVLIPISTSADSPGTYNPDDIAVINRIIDNNGLKWPKAPADGSSVPAEWGGGRVNWWNDPTNKRLVTLCIGNENLTGVLDLCGLDRMTYLDCSNNQLTALILSQNTALQRLECTNNLLTTLDLRNNTKLKTVDCINNYLGCGYILGYENTRETELYYSPQNKGLPPYLAENVFGVVTLRRNWLNGAKNIGTQRLITAKKNILGIS